MAGCFPPNWFWTPCWKAARGLPSRENSPGAPSQTGGLTWRRPKRCDLIHARTELALAAANEQLAGKLSQRINLLRDEMIKTLAHVEAHIVFPMRTCRRTRRRQLIERAGTRRTVHGRVVAHVQRGTNSAARHRAAIIGRRTPASRAC